MSRSRVIFNLVLVAGAIALGAALWLTRKPPAPGPAPVSTIAAAAIHRIEVHAADNVIVIGRDKTDARWRLHQPISARADAGRVAALIALAKAIPEHRYPRGAIDSDKTGLGDPKLTVRFNDEAPIAVGGPGPTPGSRYVRTAHALLLVRADDLEDKPLSWTHWIAPGLLAADARLTRLTLPNITLTRSETGGWQVEPANADRGADYAQATIDAWHHCRALAIEPIDHSRARIARVTLHFADEPDRHIDVIARSPELVLRDTGLGVDYHLAANQAAPLLDMQHPDALGAARGDSLQPSAIPLQSPDTPQGAGRAVPQ